MLMGGSGALISLFNLLVDRSLGSRRRSASRDTEFDGAESWWNVSLWPGWLAVPLIELQRWLRLVWAVQYCLLLRGRDPGLDGFCPCNPGSADGVTLERHQCPRAAESGPLAAASQAYESGNAAAPPR